VIKTLLTDFHHRAEAAGLSATTGRLAAADRIADQLSFTRPIPKTVPDASEDVAAVTARVADHDCPPSARSPD